MNQDATKTVAVVGSALAIAGATAAYYWHTSQPQGAPLKTKPRHGGELVAEVLEAHKVKFLFTLIGGHISPVLVAAKARGIRVIDCRHEVTCVFAADAVSRLSESVGVACVTAGPGLTNTITAVKNAQMAHSPLVLLGGATLGLLKGRGSLQDIDQQALFAGQCKWQTTVSRVCDIVPTLERAFHMAKSGVPGPVFVELPIDILYPEATIRKEVLKPVQDKKDIASRLTKAYIEYYLYTTFRNCENLHHAVVLAVREMRPPAHAVQKAAEMLRAAQRPVLVLGSACVGDGRAAFVASAARVLNVPTYLAGGARGLLGERDPIQFRHDRGGALKKADLVILCGVPCDFRLKYGGSFSSSTPLISVHFSQEELYKNRTPTLPVLASPASFIVRLADLMRNERPVRAPWFDELRKRESARDHEIDEQANAKCKHNNVIKLCQRIDAALTPNSIIVADGGDFIGTAAYVLRPRGPLSWLDPGPFGTLGVGAGFALGAKLCRPDADVWLLWGDGSAGYSIFEYDTFVRHGVSVIGVIGNDSCWTQIARDQVTTFQDDVGCPLSPDCHYERVAASLGGAGWCVADDGSDVLGRGPTVGRDDDGYGGRLPPQELDAVLERAKFIAGTGRPTLVNAMIGASTFREGSISI